MRISETQKRKRIEHTYVKPRTDDESLGWLERGFASAMNNSGSRWMMEAMEALEALEAKGGLGNGGGGG